MNKKVLYTSAALCALVLSLSGTIASAQTAEVTEKPRMYSYVSNWQIPRAHWGEVEQSNAADEATLKKAVADGILIGYGHDENMVHTPEGYTHDDWWSSMSIGGLVKVLDQFYAAGSTASPVLVSATKHADDILVSRYYNWTPGSYKGIYTHVSSYQLKADAPDNAIDLLAKDVIGPMMEKALADGTIREWEIDTAYIHTSTPGTFWVVYLSNTPEGLDKVQDAVREHMKGNPLLGQAFSSMTDYTHHRDELDKSTGIYK